LISHLNFFHFYKYFSIIKAAKLLPKITIYL